MQVRYVFDSDLQRAGARLAWGLIPRLAAITELKAEAATGKPAESWKPLYNHFSKPMLMPKVQLFDGDLKSFRPHPLQWNILINPPESHPDADEIWVYSPEKAQMFKAAGVAAEKLKVLPPAAGGLTAGESPMDLSEPKVLLCSLADSPDLEKRLTAVLSVYLPAFYGQSDVTLALHLPENFGEERLLTLIEKLGAEKNLDIEALNLETWLGALEPSAYLGLLARADILLAPDDALQAEEARQMGKTVLGEEITELSAEQLKSAFEKPAVQAASDHSASLEALVSSINAQLRRIESEVDFDARAARWQELEQVRQGRKQKYSLFHSDYQEPEMQARRQWHLRYARHFEGVPGDVVDIGCGSGIFLEIMRDLGLPACGVDPDPDMVEVCQSLDLQALPGDERLLSEWQNESLGGIHASHVIEHIDGSRAIAFVENALRVLKPGGKLLVRTPNWRNEMVRHEGFWLDITHIRPYPLPLLQQVFTDAGFTVELQGFEEFGWNDTYIIGRKPGGQHG